MEACLPDYNLNIIIPVYNEGEKLLPWLEQVLSYLSPADSLVVVDASEADDTQRLLSTLVLHHKQLHFLKSDKGRALQMNAGAEYLLSLPQLPNARFSSLLWFLHSDSGLSREHLEYLHQLDPSVDWGRFDVLLTADASINNQTFPFDIISKLINLRSRLTQVMTGDQGIFIRSDVFQSLKGYASIPLMEDVEISKRLRSKSKADCQGPILKTSARRWQQQGWLKTVLLMWKLRLMYWLGISPTDLVRQYYG